MPFLYQPSFAGGEISPKLQARVDLTRYNVGAALLQNFICSPTGGISNRAGTYYLGDVEDHSKRHRLVPFQFNISQTYSLVFGDYTLRFIANDGYVINDLTSGTYKWTASGSGTNEYYMELLAGGDPGVLQAYNVYEDSAAMDEGTAGSLSVSEWDWGDNDSLGYNTIYVRLSDGSDPDTQASEYLYTIIEVPTPYASADLTELYYCQSADVMYFVHPDYYPYKLSRTSNIYWTMTTAPLSDGPWYNDPDGTGISLTPSARSGSSIELTSDSAYFTSAMVGRDIRLGYQNLADTSQLSWGYCSIDSYSSSTKVIVTVIENFGWNYVLNNTFESGLAYWSDESTGSGSVSIADISGDFQAQLEVYSPTDVAEIQQNDIFLPQGKYSMFVTTEDVSSSGTLSIKLGTSQGASDKVNQTTTGTGTVEYEFNIGVDDYLYASIEWAESATSTATITISDVSIIAKPSDNYLKTSDWRITPWSDGEGYPSVAGFFEQRLTFGGSANQPQTMWHSVTGAYESFAFTTPTADDDAFSYQLASGQANQIDWIAPLQELLIGTKGSEWKVQRGEGSAAMTPSSIDAKLQSQFGGAPVIPLTVGNSVLFAQRGARAIRDFGYSLETDGYTGNDISILASHLFEDYSLEEWAYSSKPDSVIWGIRSDGTLLGCTYVKEQQVFGWHRHVTDGQFESVCVLPSDTGEDTVYFIVNRTINGSTKRYIEKLMPRITDEDTYDFFFVDCGLSYNSSTSTTTVSNLDHLEGETVSVLADGGVVYNKVVSSGSITLDNAANVIHVGLPYTSDMQSLELDLTIQDGTSQGRFKTVPKVYFKVYKTRGLFAGPDFDNLEEAKIRDESEGITLQMFTGYLEIPFDSPYTDSMQVCVRNTDPIPVTILAISPELLIPEADK